MNEQEFPITKKDVGYAPPYLKFPEEQPFKIKGLYMWGSAGTEWWNLLFETKELPPDTTISTDRIVLRVSMHPYPVQMFEITATKKDLLADIKNVKYFLNNLRYFIAKSGYQLKAFPATISPPALPPPIDAAEITELFEGFITALENNIASVTLVDDSGEKSYMEIPCEDLQKFKIECKAGALFSFSLKRRGDWESVELAPTHRPPMTRAELDKLLDYYEEKYGDV